MYRLSTKITAFFFLLIVSVPVLLSLNFILTEMQIQQEVEEKLKTEVLQTIRVAEAEITWIRAGKEVLLNGRLFDVKYISSDNNVVTLTGFFDTEEAKLFSDLKNYTEHGSKDNPASEFAFKFQFPPVYISHFEMTFETNWRSISNQYHSFVSILPTAPNLTLIHPPRLKVS
jgi:hypothetical protein